MDSRHLRIKSHFSIIAHSANLVELRSGVWNQISHTLEDEDQNGNLYKFIQLLDGTHNTSDITKQLQMRRADAEAIIDQLKNIDVLENQSSTALDYYIDLYAPAFKHHQRSEHEISTQSIFVIADHELGTEIKNTLKKNAQFKNIGIITESDPISKILKGSDDAWLSNPLIFSEMIETISYLKNAFFIMAFDHINPIIAKRFNRIATALNITWIHAAIDGPFVFIGPLFEPNQTACYECFETRISLNLREYHSYQKYKNAITSGAIHKKSSFQLNQIIQHLLISHLNIEITNYLLTRCCFTKNKVLSIYLPTMEIAFNEFIKVSGCQICGSQPRRDDHQMYFDTQALLRDLA